MHSDLSVTLWPYHSTRRRLVDRGVPNLLLREGLQRIGLDGSTLTGSLNHIKQHILRPDTVRLFLNRLNTQSDAATLLSATTFRPQTLVAMLDYTSFVLAGAGALGGEVARALLEQGFKVTVLSRSRTGARGARLAAAGATVQVVDYANANAVAAAIALGPSFGSDTTTHTRLPDPLALLSQPAFPLPILIYLYTTRTTLDALFTPG